LAEPGCEKIPTKVVFLVFFHIPDLAKSGEDYDFWEDRRGE
jgi:hypothetical protein